MLDAIASHRLDCLDAVLGRLEHDPDDGVRASAMGAMQAIAPNSQDNALALRSHVDQSGDVRRAATQLLREWNIKISSEEDELEAIDRGHWGSLARYGKAILPFTARILNEPQSDMFLVGRRVGACLALGDLGASNKHRKDICNCRVLSQTQPLKSAQR